MLIIIIHTMQACVLEICCQKTFFLREKGPLVLLPIRPEGVGNLLCVGILTLLAAQGCLHRPYV